MKEEEGVMTTLIFLMFVLMFVMGTLIRFIITSTRIHAPILRRVDRTGPPRRRQLRRGEHPLDPYHKITAAGRCNTDPLPPEGRILSL